MDTAKDPNDIEMDEPVRLFIADDPNEIDIDDIEVEAEDKTEEQIIPRSFSKKEEEVIMEIDSKSPMIEETKDDEKNTQQLQDMKVKKNANPVITQHREKELKLVYKIINNILSFPNNKSFHDLNLKILSNKLNDNIWFDLLLNAGFYRSIDGNRLLFDESKREQLKNIHNILLTMGSYEIKKQCVCGNSIQISNVNGFDICNNCISFYSPDMFQLDNKPNDCVDHNNDDISECVHLKRILNDMNDMGNNINTLQMVNDYLHLLDKHDNDNDFGFIGYKFGYCDITQCIMFKRNNRNRSAINANNELPTNDIISYEILCKIHCYFAHCYDIGNRLSIKDKEMIYNDISDSKDDSQENLVNKSIIKINQLLQRKRMIYGKLCDRLSNTTKFNQLFVEHKEENKEGNMYSFGYKFLYEKDDPNPDGEHIRISPKYNSLKEEVTINEISRIRIQQFHNEYAKAIVHFNSFHCKQLFRPFIQYNKALNYINIQCILSLMLYCNYDSLQYELTKTYREDKGNNYIYKHEHFYYLAKHLKISTNTFGTCIADGNVSAFYHGISVKLVFPGYILYNEGKIGLNIYGPLSTSESLEVALNFTNHNKGLVVKFSDDIWKLNGASNFFSLSWLSDYPNEKECLFVQNKERFAISDIIEPQSGYEYNAILKTLKTIQQILVDDHNDSVDENITDEMEVLMVSIISNQLSNTLSKYEPFESLSPYGKKICDIFFKNQTYILMNFVRFTKKYSFIREFICHTHYEWINMSIVDELFPNLTDISLNNVNLSSSTLHDICNNLVNKHCMEHLKLIKIEPNKNSQLSAKRAVQIYRKQLKDIGVSDIYIEENTLYISRGNESKPNDDQDLQRFFLTCVNSFDGFQDTETLSLDLEDLHP